MATAAFSACRPSPPADAFLTRAERTDYRETSSYADVVDFLERAAAASPAVHYTTYGFTNEGRALPLAVVGDVADPTPAAVRASGKTVVYLQGNIHAGEVCGKEALQMLLRDLLAGQHGEWRESMILLIAPIYNADGNERVTLTNRGRQHGPIGGMGQRPNAQGYDLNRDHMKLESPEARSVARLLNEYDPQVSVDLHTTNGTRHAYHLTYSPPLHPNTPAEIDGFLRGGLLPQVTEAILQKHGWHYYYYGNAFAPGGGERGWFTFDHRPRFNNSYIGLRNRIAILSEAYSYATFEERVLATLYFVEEILDYVHEHADEVRQIVADADAASVVGESLALRAAPERSAAPVDILMGAVVEEAHPLTGLPLLLLLRRYPVRRAHVRVRDLRTDAHRARPPGLPDPRRTAGHPDPARGPRYRVGAGRGGCRGCRGRAGSPRRRGLPHRFGRHQRAPVPGPQRANPLRLVRDDPGHPGPRRHVGARRPAAWTPALQPPGTAVRRRLRELGIPGGPAGGRGDVSDCAGSWRLTGEPTYAPSRSSAAAPNNSSACARSPLRHHMTPAAPRFVGLRASDLDRRSLRGRRLPVDEALVPRRRLAARDADRGQLVDSLGACQEQSHGPEGLATEVHVGAGDDHPHAGVRQRIDDLADAVVQELGLIDRDDLRCRVDPLRDLQRVGHGFGVDLPAVVGRDPELAAVTVVEVRLEELDPPARDQRAPHPPDQLFGLAAEHDAGDDLDPSVC